VGLFHECELITRVLQDLIANFLSKIIHPRHCLTLCGHINTAEQRKVIQQRGDWYTDRWWVAAARPVPSSLYQM